MEEQADEVIVNVGRRLAEIRRALDLTQLKAAEQLKMPLKNLQALEAGRNLTIRTLVRIARGFGVPVRTLFDPPTAEHPRRRGRPKRDPV